MRIVIATAVYYPQVNGVAVFSHNLAVGLARKGHEVMVICPSQTGKTYRRLEDGVSVQYLKSIDAKVYPDQIHTVLEKKRFHGLKLPRMWYKHGLRVCVFPQREVAKVLEDFAPDVVHVQVSDPIGLSVVGWARRNKVPVVTTEHNQPEVLTDSLKMPKMLKRGANHLLYSYFRNRQRKSDFATMPTKLAILNLTSKGELGVPIAAVSNGVDLSSFKPGRAPAEIYRKYDIRQGVPTVLYVGRVDPEKKVGLVIEAFKQAREKLPKKQGREGDSSDSSKETLSEKVDENPSEAQLIIVGDGVDKARLEKVVAREGLDESVKFVGRVMPPDLYELYKVGEVFATASEIETQGIVLIEAAACGLPLVAVDAGAVAEVCQNGVNGFLCEPGNASEISEAIARIVSNKNLQKRFAEKSLEIAGEHDFEKTLGKYINIYNRVINDNK